GHSRVERNAEKLIKPTMRPPTWSGMPTLERIPDWRKYSASSLAPRGRSSIDRTLTIFSVRSRLRYQAANLGTGPGGYRSTPSAATEHKILAHPSGMNSPKL